MPQRLAAGRHFFMISKKQYFSRFKSSLDEQLSTMRELSIGSIRNIVEPKLSDLSNDFEGEELLVKVLVFGNPDKEFLENLSNGLCNTSLVDELADIQALCRPVKIAYQIDTLSVHAVFYGANAHFFEYAGLFEGHLGIVAFADEAAMNAQNFELMKRIFRQHGFLWLLKDAAVSKSNHELPETVVAAEWADVDDQASTLKQLLARPDFLSKMAIMQSFNSLLAIDTLSQSAVKFVKDAEKINRVNRLSLPVQQGTSLIKGLQESDPYTTIKYSLQQQLTQLEKNINDQLDLFFLPGTGPFWGKVFPTIDTLNRLDTIEKAKTNVLKVPDKASDLFLAHTRAVLEQQFQQFTQHINNSIRSVESDVQQTCERKNILPLQFFITFLDEKDARTTLDSAIRIERPYEANVQRKGFYEYFMAIRKYQMVFLMMMSLFGIGSFIRKQPKIMITATLILTAFGAFMLRKTVKQEREEQTEKELEKARETLKDEAKRMSSETAQRWRKQLSDYFKTLSGQLVRQVEETAQSYLLHKHSTLEDEKRLQQRLLQNLDNTDKQFANFYRNQEMWQRNQTRLKAELKTEFLRVR